ncbi:unnamed protein product [Larinioides sclopetarius]|uniref:Uncharacterized protein n=1 Tax=Larinioides sclopetarius TaxID=280406 RepID=A0AAV2BZL6_9ARAC
MILKMMKISWCFELMDTSSLWIAQKQNEIGIIWNLPRSRNCAADIL